MNVISCREAAGLIRDGWTVSTSRFTGSGYPRDLTLIEIAPGIDLEREVRAQIAPGVAVARDLKAMDARIFRDQPMLAAAP